MTFNCATGDHLTGSLRLIENEIDIAGSQVLFKEHITGENLTSHFDVYNSKWTVEDGWLTGKNPDESAGMAFLKLDFPGNVLLEFECRSVPPSTHDINFIWNGEWSPGLNSCGNGYIGSICGWYTNRIGIEKSPDYRLRATTPNNDFIPGRIYKVQAGNYNGTCFIFIDGKLALEVNDPYPLDSTRYAKVAFCAWSSHIQIKNIIIRRVSCISAEMKYMPEF
jgi:hypothetical protein